MLIKPKEEEEVDLEEEEVDEEDEMRPAAATVEDAAIVNILYSFCDVLSELFCLLSKYPKEEPATHTAAFADIISFFFAKNQRLTSN